SGAVPSRWDSRGLDQRVKKREKVLHIGAPGFKGQRLQKCNIMCQEVSLPIHGEYYCTTPPGRACASQSGVTAHHRAMRTPPPPLDHSSLFALHPAQHQQ
ncbi:unnamed protein product, partial [Pylaiella littoralis]